MSIYQLQIIHRGEKNIITLTEGETLRISAQEDTQYQFVNEQGEALSEITAEHIGQDLNLYLTASDKPDVIIYDYAVYAPANSEAVLNTKILASEVATVGKMAGASVLPFAIAGASLLGAHFAVTSGSKSKVASQEKPTNPGLPENKPVEPSKPEEPQPVEPSTPEEPKPVEPSTPEEPEPVEPSKPEEPQPVEPPKPINGEIILNSINAKNLLNTDHLGETLIVSGHIRADQPIVNATVQLEIHGEIYPATLNLAAQTFQLSLPAEKLAQAQGQNQIKARVSFNVGLENASEANNVLDYQVDTVSPQAVFTFNPLPTINQSEAEKTHTLTGKIDNSEALASQTATLQLNGKDYPLVIAQDGSWTLEVAGSELAFAQGTQALTVNLLSTDAAGNTHSQTFNENYQVDTVSPQAVFTFNPLPTINQSEAEKTHTLTGKIDNSEALASQTATLQLNGKDYPLVIAQDGSWTVKVAGSALAFAQGTQALTVNLVSTDPAGNTHTQTFSENYQVDTVSPQAVFTFNPLPTINQSEAEKTHTLSGKIDNSEALANQSATLQLNGKDYPLVIAQDGSWTVEVAGSELAFAQGTQALTVNLVSTDAAGNTNTQTFSENYQVDTVSPTATFTFNPLPTINQTEAAKTHTLKGKIENSEALASQTATLQLNGKDYPLVIAQDGSWTLEVAGSELAFKQGTLPFAVKVESTDTAGNTHTQTSNESYQVDTVLDKPSITINPVTEDNSLSNQERSQGIVLSGTVDYADDVDPASVTVTLNIKGEQIPAEVNGKTWSAKVAGEKLNAEADEAQISASVEVQDRAKNSATNQASHTYAIENEKEDLGVEIRSIGENNAVIDPTQMSRISGTLAFDGIYGQYYNAFAVGQLKVNIGDKSYVAGFRGKEKTFFVDIPTDELAALNGQEITLDFSDSNKAMYLYYLDKARENAYTMRRVDPLNLTPGKNISWLVGKSADDTSWLTPKLAEDGMQLTGVNVENQGGKFVVNAKAETTTITGVGTGAAKAGDKVEMHINGKAYSTTLNEDKTFSLEVLSADLRNQKEQNVKAVLTSGEQQAVDSAHYSAIQAVGSEFVSLHQRVQQNDKKLDHSNPENYNMPYFIFANEGKNSSFSGYLNRNKEGSQTPFHIKYHFFDKEKTLLSVGQRRQYLEAEKGIQDATEWAYKKYAEYANIVAERVDFDTFANNAYLSPGTLVAKAFLNTPTLAAVAGAGGSLSWANTINPNNMKDNQRTAVHELGHNFGLGHSHSQDLTGDNKVFYATEGTREFTTMSYTDQPTALQRTEQLRPYDLATVHYRFGVNKKARAGNDTYGFKDYNVYSDGGDIYIWDGDGIDTFDASQEKEGVMVNLTPGSWIHRGETLEKHLIVKELTVLKKHIYYGFGDITDKEVLLANNGNRTAQEAYTIKEFTHGQAFIGYGTQIENLIGSAFNDKLSGNKADNNIFGGDGNDVIKGDAGNDYLDGGKGNDEMHGGTGDDSYIIDNVNDVVVELANEGTDTVFSTVDYTLGDHLENLTLLGFTATQGIGNALDNRLVANNIGNMLNGGAGNDILVGGSGADTLIGGAGNDIFVFNDSLNGKVDQLPDFNPSEDKIRLNKVIFTELNTDLSNFSQHIRYNAETGELSYRADPADAKSEKVFAQLPTGLSLSKDAFIVAYPDVPTPSINMMQVHYNNLLSKKDIDGTVELNGYLRVAPHLVDSVKVSVNINGQDHLAEVDKVNLTWKFTIAGEALRAGSDGTKNITATATVTDAYGQTVSSTPAQQAVQIDTEFTTPPPTVTATEVSSDNILDASEISQSIKLAGQILNIGEALPQSIRVQVDINGGESFYATRINTDQKLWELNLPGYLLTTNQSENSLKVTIRGEDKAGNPFEEQTNTLTYQIAPDAQKNVITVYGKGETATGTDGSDIFVLSPLLWNNRTHKANGENPLADTIKNFTKGQDKILMPLLQDVFKMFERNSLKPDFSNFDNRVSYDKDTGRLSYDISEGVRYKTSHKIHIATFQAGLNLEQSDFLIGVI